MFIPTASYGKKWVLLTAGLSGAQFRGSEQAAAIASIPSFVRRWGNRQLQETVRQFVRDTAMGDASVAINNATIATLCELISTIAKSSSDAEALLKVVALLPSRWLRLHQTVWTDTEINDYFRVGSQVDPVVLPSERRIWLAVVAYLCRDNNGGYLVSPMVMGTLVDRFMAEFALRVAQRLAYIPMEEGALSYHKAVTEVVSTLQQGRFTLPCGVQKFRDPAMIAFTVAQLAQELFGVISLPTMYA